MQRGFLFLLFALVCAVGAYYGSYRAGTMEPRAMLTSKNPELLWLKNEFKLGEQEYNRIVELHSRYVPQCESRCAQIEKLNQELSSTLSTLTELTPAMQELLMERARIWAVCQQEMLKHFLEVSRTMPQEQGKRYLDWVSRNSQIKQEPMHHGNPRGESHGNRDRHP